MRKAAAFSVLAALAIATPPAALTFAGNWPGWRGPEGTGVAADKDLPTEWGREKNVRWRVDLPGPGNGSPAVWGDKVFVAQAVPADHQRTVLCFDRNTGKLLWQSGVNYADKEPSHESNPPCGGTPAVDGERVYVCYGSAGVAAYDLAGKDLWKRDLGKLNHMFGNAVSPVLHGDLCILNFGPDPARARLVALKKATGEVAWEAAPPGAGPTGGPGPGGMAVGIVIAGPIVLAGDKDRDEELSKAEFAALADDWFTKLDADKAGKLTKKRFCEGLDGLLSQTPGTGSAPPAKGTPGNGSQGRPAEPAKPPEPATPPESAKPPQPVLSAGMMVGPGLFAAVDANKDGSLTREEWVGTMRKWAVQWDADKSGSLDETEIRDGLNAELPPFSFGPPNPPPPPKPGDGKPNEAAGGGPAWGSTSGVVPDGSWATPVVVKTDGHDELVVGFPQQLAGYDPATGRLLWTCKGLNSQIYTSVLPADGMLIALSSGLEGGSAIAVRPGGSGDVTDARRAWRADRVKSAIGSGVVRGGRFYHAGADGVAECFDAKSGKKLWQKRLSAASDRSGVWASAVLAGDRIYLANQGGDVFVLRAGPKFELLATNSVDEPTNASPAAADGQLFLRTNKALWCFGSKD